MGGEWWDLSNQGGSRPPALPIPSDDYHWTSATSQMCHDSAPLVLVWVHPLADGTAPMTVWSNPEARHTFGPTSPSLVHLHLSALS